MGLFNKSKKTKKFNEEWQFFPCYSDNTPFSVRFNDAVASLDEKTKAAYPHTLELTIFAEETNEEEMPSPSERERINAIEDTFCYGDYDIQHIGVVTGGGQVRFVFCYNGSPKGEDIAKTLLSKTTEGVKYEFREILNDHFAYYNNALAPTLYERNWISDLQVCTNMESHGEVFKTPRTIDFACYFPSKEHIQIVTERLTALGFAEMSCEKTEDGNYLLLVTREDIPEFERINEWTVAILEALGDTNGSFDGWGAVIHTA